MRKSKKCLLSLGMIILLLPIVIIIWRYNREEEPIQPKNFHMYLKKAVNGNTDAQAIVGGYYLDNYYIKPNYSEAEYWFKLASEGGDNWATFQLCGIYSLEGLMIKKDRMDVNGKKLELNVDKAVQYCTKSKGYYSLGNMFYELKNYTLAFKYFSLGKYNFELARMYLYGEGVEQDYEKAFAFLKQDVLQSVDESSDIKDGFSYEFSHDTKAQALYMLANAYEAGIGTAQNHEKALHYYFLAAQTASRTIDNAKNMQALIQISNSEQGPKTTLDTQKMFSNSYDFGNLALQKMAEFAERKDINAIALLGSLGIIYGKCYTTSGYFGYYPSVCPVSMENLRNLLEFAAENGSVLAQYVLGRAILFNWDSDTLPSQDKEVVNLANAWFLKAAQQGSLLAQISLGNTAWTAPTQMYAWCKMALENETKFPAIYQELTTFKGTNSIKFDLKYFVNCQGRLDILSKYADESVVREGKKLFNDYWKIYGGYIYESKKMTQLRELNNREHI